MILSEVLRKNGKAIREQCIAALAGLYPPETAAYLLGEKDRFRNPVGFALRGAVDDLFGILSGAGAERLKTKESFREAVRILAVQTSGPSDALFFIRSFKEAVFGELIGGCAGAKDFRELLAFGKRLDDALMDAFDLYVEYRGRVADVKVNEVKAEKERLARLLKALTGRGRKAAGAVDGEIAG